MKETVIARTGGKRMTSSITAEYGAGAELKYTAELAGFAGQTPYFGVTGEVSTAASRRRNDIEAGGCLHELILKHFPEAAPVVALHLSDADGVPMHAAANALYWVGGALGWPKGYHGGNGNFPKTHAECFDILASHLRLTDEATCELLMGFSVNGNAASYMTAFCDAQRPRWKAEADAALAWIMGHAGSYANA